MSDQVNQNPEVGYFVVDQRKSRRAYALTRDQIWWLAIWLSIAITIGIQWFVEDLRPLAIIPIAVCAAAWKTSNGIIFRNIQAHHEERQLKRRKGMVYQGRADKPPLGLGIYAFEAEFDAGEMPQVIRDNLSPQQFDAIVDANRTTGFSIGTVYSKHEKTDTAYISGTGLAGSNGDPAEMFFARKGVTDAIARAISIYDKPPSFCMIYSRRPVNLIPQLLWDQASVDPAVRDAKHLELRSLPPDDKGREQLDVDGFFTGSVEERQALALNLARADVAVSGEEVTQLTAISFHRPRFYGVKPGSSLDGKLTPRQLRRMPINRLAEAFREEMANAGISDATILNFEDVQKVVRTGWDVASISEWQQQVLSRALEIEESGKNLPMPNPWLKADGKIVSTTTKDGRPYIKFGDTYLRVKQLSSFRKTNFFAEDLLPIFDAAEFQPAAYSGLTVSACGDIIDVRSEQRILSRKRAIAAGYEDSRRDRGERIETAEDIEKRNALKNKSDSLHFGGVYALSYNAYVTIAALTLDQLEDFDDLVDAHGRSCGVEFRYINNEVRHVRTLATALWGVNMVNR